MIRPGFMKISIKQISVITLLIGLFSANLGAFENEAAIKQAAADSLDKFHLAAEQADTKTYFGLLTQNAVFLGTDATERWTKQQFKLFVEPYFAKGQGWKYVPTVRQMEFLPEQQIIIFDELLENTNYGTTRGSGVLIKTDSGWKIAQYNLSIPMPNDIATDLVKKIREFESKTK